jgi:type VI secretion system protein VasG
MDNRHIKALIEKLNPVCAKVLEDAAIFAGTRGNYEVRIEHYLIKLLEGETGTDMDYLLKRFEVDLDAFWHKMLESLSRAEAGNQGKPTFSISIFQWLERAWLASTLYYDQEKIRSVALLDALIDLAPALPVNGLEMLETISLDLIRKDYPRLVDGSREETASPTNASVPPQDEGRRRASGDTNQGHPALDQFTTNLTQRAASGELDPIRGRNGEIRMLIDILCRRRKNNPILVGDPGVGKTALVEGLALRIAAGDVPEHLRGVELRVLDLGLLQAGAGVKGEFERRLKQVIDEVKASAIPVILFIDEAHTLIGAGGEAGVGDAANLIKPALARGELRTIAATTWAEYKKYFERDAALERRFQMVKVDEPTAQRAVLMLNGLKAKYEEHHDILITDEAIESAVQLSARYIPDRQLPDKAIDLLDTAAARVRMGHAVAPEAMESLREHIQFIQQRLDNLSQEKEAGIRIDSALLKELTAERDQSQLRLDELEARWQAAIEKLTQPRELLEAVETSDEDEHQLTSLHREVTPAVIAEVVSEWTGIPAGRMFRSELATLMSLEERLGERIVGQEMALAQIGESLRNVKAGLRSSDGPLGVFLLAGPSGIGKTETALAIADEIFGGEASLITINMSEYQESHTSSQLKGSPPGYVGYGEGGVLTEAVRQRPYSAVLLDEVEKAHPDVMNLFYQVFDRGIMRDGEGREIDFRNTVILMTSNLGSEAMLQRVETQRMEVEQVLEQAESEAEEDLSENLPQPLSLSDIVETIKPSLLSQFAPALLGRMQIVPYLPLDLEALQGIVALKLDAIGDRLQQAHGIEFRYLPEVAEQIAGRCINHDAGARFINTLIGQQLMPAISQQLLQALIDDDKPEIVSLEYDEGGELSCLFIDRVDAETPEAQQAVI